MADAKEYNSSGERLYRDSAGAKCNLREMLQREPEWVISRFGILEADNKELRDILQWLVDLQNGCPLPKYEPKYEPEWGQTMQRAQAALDAGKGGE